jgi:hypothetical protein
MDLFSIVKKYMEQIGGQFTDYDTTKAIMVVPLEHGRFHTIILTFEKNKTTGKQFALFTTKVCEYTSTINLKELLEQNAATNYSKFILEDSQIKVEAAVPVDGSSEDELKHIIQEVANIADSYELKLTGKDIH